MRESSDGELCKDLRQVDADLSKVLIVDNLEENFGDQRDNGILIRSWYGDQSDDSLNKLIPILLRFKKSHCGDVREFLKELRLRGELC